jgi:hypothetical protein
MSYGTHPNQLTAIALQGSLTAALALCLLAPAAKPRLPPSYGF